MRNLLFLLLIGLVVYAVISLVLRVRSGTAGPSGTPSPPRTGGWRPVKRRGPVAPDDDPEFLWMLEQQQRQADRDAHHDPKAGDPKAGDPKDGHPKDGDKKVGRDEKDGDDPEPVAP